MTAPNPLESPLAIDGHALSREERWVVHSALLAQVDDMHAGGVYMWGEREQGAAVRVLSRLTGERVGADPLDAPAGCGSSLSSRVVVIAVMVPVYELDHPDMEAAEWAEAERLVSVLAREFGR